MAVKKTTRKKNQESTSNEPQVIIIFWLAFIVIIVSVFMFNAPTIKNNFELFTSQLGSQRGSQENQAEEERPEEPVIQEPPRVVQVTTQEPRQEPAAPPRQEPAAVPVTEPARQPPPAATERPAPQVEAPVQTRDRNIYFTQIDRNGQILHSRVTRRIPVSESPMQDALNALLIGPSADELNRGILNLIPPNTRILSATVRGSTAYINFSEDFLFNTFGVEGYIAQLRQIIWTVTEFSNVNDVQILIEGRRMDYLGEGIWIGSPVSRQSY